jgi:hypothetical protein
LVLFAPQLFPDRRFSPTEKHCAAALAFLAQKIFVAPSQRPQGPILTNPEPNVLPNVADPMVGKVPLGKGATSRSRQVHFLLYLS